MRAGPAPRRSSLRSTGSAVVSGAGPGAAATSQQGARGRRAVRDWRPASSHPPLPVAIGPPSTSVLRATRPDGSRHLLDAVALQDHFARRLKLSLAPPRAPSGERAARGGAVRPPAHRPVSAEAGAAASSALPGPGRPLRSSSSPGSVALLASSTAVPRSAASAATHPPPAARPRAAGGPPPRHPSSPAQAATRAPGPGHRLGHAPAAPSAPEGGSEAHRWQCEACGALNASDEDGDRCRKCDALQPLETRPGLSLAQRRGLVPAPPPLLSRREWEALEQSVSQRLHAEESCTICREPFGPHAQFLLCCGHAFHQHCLQAFERFSAQRGAERACPLCRRAPYQRRVAWVGALTHPHVMARRIQARVRGHRARRWVRELRAQAYAEGGGDPEARRRYFLRSMSTLSSRLNQSMHRREQALDSLFAELDRGMALSRRVFAAMGGGGTLAPPPSGLPAEAGGAHGCGGTASSGTDWHTIRATAMERGDLECPICLNAANTHKRCYLLSCSHVFHTTCLESFEAFVGDQLKQCPMCRVAYHRIDMSFEGE